MLFSEETDRKCFSVKWGDKSDVSLREALMCFALHNRCPHRGIKNALLKNHGRGNMRPSHNRSREASGNCF